MIAALQKLGASTLATLGSLGRSVLFLLRVVLGLGELARRPGLLIQQLYSVGVLTLVRIGGSGL